MKKLLSLIVLVLCAALAMAQFVHVASAEADDCDTVKTEQHIAQEASAKADSHDAQSTGKVCCESCHVQLLSLPLMSAITQTPAAERIISLPTLAREVSPETLSEPPQA